MICRFLQKYRFFQLRRTRIQQSMEVQLAVIVEDNFETCDDFDFDKCERRRMTALPIDAVASHLCDGERNVRVAAADALSRMGAAADVHADKVADILLREGSLKSAIEAHGRMGSMGRGRLVGALLTGNLEPRGKLDVCRAAIAMTQDWVPQDVSVVASAAKACSSTNDDNMKQGAEEVLSEMIKIGTGVLCAAELENFTKSIIFTAVQATNCNLEEATMQLQSVRALMGGSIASVPILEDVQTAWDEQESETDIYMTPAKQFYDHDKANLVRPTYFKMYSDSECSEDSE